MANIHVIKRLKAIQAVLASAREGGKGLSSLTIGSERESFLNLVLGNVIAPPFRIGTGEITDHASSLSGQVDIVVEYSNTISFPMLQANAARLYLAESVCCVIEVKSDVEKQLDHVIQKAEKLNAIKRDPGTVAWTGSMPNSTIPLFAVGFAGWSNSKTIEKAMSAAKARANSLSGVLILDPGIYVGGDGYESHSRTGPESIFGFLLSLEQLTSSMLQAKPKLSPYID